MRPATWMSGSMFAVAAVHLLGIGGCVAVDEETNRSGHAIVGGQQVATCAWPTAVSFGGCDGVLVHPRVVLTAAHCLGGRPLAQVTLGESFDRPALTLAVQSCQSHPKYLSEAGFDIGFCTLAEEASAVPLVPVMPACELGGGALDIGQQAMLVGFGYVGDGMSGNGLKRSAAATVREFQASGREIIIGDRARGACNGDSGGPAYVQVADGTWRVVGVVSRMGSPVDGGTAANCASTTLYTAIAPHVAWLETASGFDVTACHEGPSWKPGEHCRQLPAASSMDPGGVWASSCADDRVLAPAPTCLIPVDAAEGAYTPPVDAGSVGDSDTDGGTADSGYERTRDARRANDAAESIQPASCAVNGASNPRSVGQTMFGFAALVAFNLLRRQRRKRQKHCPTVLPAEKTVHNGESVDAGRCG